jgi:glycosyltransferase involved in cell wall biosynthesis
MGVRRSLPVVVQHSAGERGDGGPVMALESVLASPLSDRYRFVRMHQQGRNGGLNLRLLRDWAAVLRQVKPDLVHVRGLQGEGLHGVLAARMAGCPRIMVTVHGTVRDLQTYGRSWRRFALQHAAEPVTLGAATHIATVCQYAAGRSFVQRFSPKFLGVVPNGVVLPTLADGDRSRVRAQEGLGPADLVLITVSRLTWEKGFATLVEAMRRLPVPPVRPVLLIVGDGPDRSGIEAAFRTVPAVDVRFLGRRLDVGALLRAADLFVFPTLHENLSLALLEAMAHGLPVVASAVGGNVEVLARGGGMLIPSGDPQVLSDAISWLLGDQSARRELGAAARRVVERHYSLDTMLTALDGMYQRVLAT